MKVFIVMKNGGVENLVLSELPMPTIKSDEVLIRTKAFSVNRVDSFVRQHEFAVEVFYKRGVTGDPIVLGWDISGEIISVGGNVKDLKVGDEVFGLINFFGQGRANAEYVAAPATHLAIKPSQIRHEEAAASCLTALTAWEAIVTYGKVSAGQTVLIHGAAGGVGHFAVQLAKHRGAKVIGTGSAGSRAFVLGLGADEFIDYAARPVSETVSDADVVIDPMPGAHVLDSLAAAKRGGRVINLLPYDDKDGKMAVAVQEKDLFTHRVVVSSNGSNMKEIASLLDTGVLKPHISKVFPFDQLPLAHTAIDSGHTKGKIVVVVP